MMLLREGRAARSGRLWAGAPVACLLALSALGAAAGASAHKAAGDSPAAALGHGGGHVRSPVPWRSYPLNQVPHNLAAQAERDACDFEAHQRDHGGRALLVFLVGRASRQHGKFGVGPDSNFHPNNRVYRALLAAGRAYRRCRSSPAKRVDIAYGVTNYKLSREISTHGGVTEAGEAQRRVAAKLARRLPGGVGAAVAGDIEPGWDLKGSGLALGLEHAAAASKIAYYTIGTSGSCRPFGSGCQGNWSYLDIGRSSQDRGAFSLPEIYYPRQAETWARIGNHWDLAGKNCPHHRRRNCYGFGGATSQPQTCSGARFTPRESWLRLRRATTRHVGRRIILFNPRHVGCRAGEPGAATPTTASQLPALPEAVPGEVVTDPDPIVSEYDLNPVVNAWRAGTRRSLTWVYAGGAGVDPATGAPSPAGRLVIWREAYRDGGTAQSIQTVDLAGAGALRIVSAPQGKRATDPSAGVIRFEGAGGAAGELDLATGALELDG